MQNDKRLLSCPFCGGEAKYIEDKDFFVSRFVTCTKCGIETRRNYLRKDLAIKDWNTRKPMERIVDRLQECKFVTSIGNDIISRNKFIAYNGALNIVRKEGGVDNAE